MNYVVGGLTKKKNYNKNEKVQKNCNPWLVSISPCIRAILNRATNILNNEVKNLFYETNRKKNVCRLSVQQQRTLRETNGESKEK